MGGWCILLALPPLMKEKSRDWAWICSFCMLSQSVVRMLAPLDLSTWAQDGSGPRMGFFHAPLCFPNFLGHVSLGKYRDQMCFSNSASASPPSAPMGLIWTSYSPAFSVTSVPHTSSIYSRVSKGLLMGSLKACFHRSSAIAWSSANDLLQNCFCNNCMMAHRHIIDSSSLLDSSHPLGRFWMEVPENVLSQARVDTRLFFLLL